MKNPKDLNTESKFFVFFNGEKKTVFKISQLISV